MFCQKPSLAGIVGNQLLRKPLAKPGKSLQLFGYATLKDSNRASSGSLLISQRQTRTLFQHLLAKAAPVISIKQVADEPRENSKTKNCTLTTRFRVFRETQTSHSALHLKSFVEWTRWLRERLIFVFFPQSYPESVTRNYLAFSAWNVLGSVSGTMTGVLATQSLLTALGMGSGSLPLAASLNWIIKDGFGLLGGVLYTGFFSGRFDSEPKRYRFLASCALQAACLMELLTVLAPGAFLLLASVSNIGKNIAWLALSGTRAQMNQSLCLRDNLGDVTAKAGTGGGILISAWMGTSLQTSLIAFVPLSFISLYSVYRSNAVITTRSLNLIRAEDLMANYFQKGTVETPEAVSAREPFVSKYQSLFSVPLVVGKSGIDQFVTETAPEQFIVSEENGGYCIHVEKKHAPSVNLWFGVNATSRATLRGFYHACRIRQRLGQSNDSDFEELTHDLPQEFDTFVEKLVEAGWSVDDVDLDHGIHGRIHFHRTKSDI